MSMRSKFHPILNGYYQDLLAGHYNMKLLETDRVLEVGCGKGNLLLRLKGIKTGLEKQEAIAEVAKSHVQGKNIRIVCGDATDPAILQGETFDVIVISDTLGCCGDVQVLLKSIDRFCHPRTKLIVNIYNTLWRPLIAVGCSLGLTDRPGTNWISLQDIRNLLELGGWDPFLKEGKILIPIPIPVVAKLMNRWLTPCLSWFSLALFCTCRKATTRQAAKLSIVIPTRNEAGTIQQAIDRMPIFGRPTELIFVEGNSTDDTWEVIQALPNTHKEGMIIKAQQSGKGKGDAVRKGFELATGDILMILDGDMTMPPEDLPKYVEAMETGKTDVSNGCRLIYNMEQNAMQFANLVANKFFGIAFSWLLSQGIKDTLCGTKALWKEDYQRIVENRAYFGDFDPFGDFDLLFGAAKQNLKIRDIPIHYKERKYGTTNIQRWRHGMILLQMLVFAARKLKFTN